MGCGGAERCWGGSFGRLIEYIQLVQVSCTADSSDYTLCSSQFNLLPWLRPSLSHRCTALPDTLRVCCHIDVLARAYEHSNAFAIVSILNSGALSFPDVDDDFACEPGMIAAR